MTLRAVLFDIGETLIDETRLWTEWADWLGVPTLTLFGVLGGLAALGEDHAEAIPMVKPGSDLETERAAKTRAGRAWTLQRSDLYPDALPCLESLRADGWRVCVGGNQPESFQRLVESLSLPVDAVTSSASLGAAKPAPEFFLRFAALAGVAPGECVHVGDRVDNDVGPAKAAGMVSVFLQRGPWGHLHARWPAASAADLTLRGLGELPGALRQLRAARSV